MSAADLEIDQAIRDKDVSLVRTILLDHIDIDVNREEFLTGQHAGYAENKLKSSNIDLFEEDDHEFEFPPKDNRNKETWQALKVEMRYNFSREKYEFILEMMKCLREEGDPYFQVKETNFTRNKTRNTDSKNRSIKATSVSKDKLIASCTLGAVTAVTVFCIARAITSSKLILGLSPFMGAGIGCLAGVIYLSTTKGEKDE